MSLHDIVRVLGGELYSGGRRASVPAPGHSPADRSVSLLVSDGRVIIHSFGEASWQAVRDDLLRRGLIDSHGTPVAGATFEPRSFAPAPTQIERVSRARALWEEASPVRPATPAWRHIRRRAVTVSPLNLPSLRSHPQVPVSAYRGCTMTRPALLAAIHDRSGELTGVEITYLTNGGLRASDIRLSRKTIGAIPAGAAVRLNPAAPSMVVGEGVFTTLSAIEHFGMPGWALLSTSNLRLWSPPKDVRMVVIAADHGVAGEAAAKALHHRLTANGVIAALNLPPAPFCDWNEHAQASRR